MQLIDVCIVAFAIFALLRGAETGLVRQIAVLAGTILGVIIGSVIANAFHTSPLTSLALVVVSVGFLSGIGESLGTKLAHAIIKMKLAVFNHIAGAATGLVSCLLIVWLGASFASAIPSPQLQSDIRDSSITAWLDDSLPPASHVIGWLDRSLAQTNLPAIIQQVEPPKAPNTTGTLPQSSEFSRVLALYKHSVVEIEGRTCGGIGVGSGFIADKNIVITNAHVVAGMRNPYITDSNGRHRAVVIGFNDDLDIAILRTDSLAGTPIPLHSDIVTAGTPAIAIGYPGGGPQKASPAIIIDQFTATGRDIYDESASTRDLYSLQADIQQGNSGGPLLDTSGRVIAVIFAKSTTYEQVGYAITMPAIIQELVAARERPTAKDNLRCTAT